MERSGNEGIDRAIMGLGSRSFGAAEVGMGGAEGGEGAASARGADLAPEHFLGWASGGDHQHGGWRRGALVLRRDGDDLQSGERGDFRHQAPQQEWIGHNSQPCFRMGRCGGPGGKHHLWADPGGIAAGQRQGRLVGTAGGWGARHVMLGRGGRRERYTSSAPQPITGGGRLRAGSAAAVMDQLALEFGTGMERVYSLAATFAVALMVATAGFNSISVTYVIGTGRWCREVVETYALAPALIERSRRIKRAAFPASLLGMLGVVAIVALGGAADPATGRPGTEAWVTPHLVGALGLVAAIAWCFQSQLPQFRRQHALIEEVLAEVRAVRLARGLDVG